MDMAFPQKDIFQKHTAFHFKGLVKNSQNPRPFEDMTFSKKYASSFCTRVTTKVCQINSHSPVYTHVLIGIAIFHILRKGW